MRLTCLLLIAFLLPIYTFAGVQETETIQINWESELRSIPVDGPIKPGADGLGQVETVKRPAFKDVAFFGPEQLPHFSIKIPIEGPGSLTVELVAPQFEAKLPSRVDAISRTETILPNTGAQNRIGGSTTNPIGGNPNNRLGGSAANQIGGNSSGNAVQFAGDRELRFLNELEIPSNIEIKAEVVTIRKKSYAVVTLMPMRKSISGEIELLQNFRLRVNHQPAPFSATANKGGRAASNSVLANGQWYKFGVPNSGMYKIDAALLTEMGIDPATIDPAYLGVFGNGGGMLAEDNAIFRHDDLVENPIYLQGLDDGSFDANDYILFYGQGPNRWTYDSLQDHFYHQKNIYSGLTYYFLTTDMGSAKGLPVIPASGPAPTEPDVTSFDTYSFREDEIESLLSSGRQFYGDFFDAFTNNRKYTFTLENRVSGEPIWLRSNVAARSAIANSNFVVKVDGNDLFTQPLSTITIGFDNQYALSNTSSATFNSSNATIEVDMTYNGDASARGWLNYLEVNARQELVKNSGAIFFRDSRSIGAGKAARFVVDAPSDVTIWDITDPVNARLQLTNNSGGLTFSVATDSLRQYVAFATADIKSSADITAIGKIDNQNLHNTNPEHPDMVIVAHTDYLSQAEELADLHRDMDDMDVLVVDVFKIYNEFSSGAQDVSAIRDFMKMFYDRATAEAELPRYLMLFGDGSYDYRNIEYDADINTNRVPAYESENSLNPISSFTSDDFYGFLDENEGSSMTSSAIGVDLGIGRLPVKTVSEAEDVVNKIKRYVSTSSFGSWRNTVSFVADDEDGKTHIEDADEIAEILALTHPEYNIDKIYLDAYQQVSGSGGERYPDVNTAINNRIFSGTFIMNFTGHGSESSWTAERVLGVSDINSWENLDKLPLFITATCSFSRYDEPAGTSAGEQLLLSSKGGAIGLITTVRLVFSNANRTINEKIFDVIFEPLPSGEMPALGDVISDAKNQLISISDGVNNRKFCLLGDPALKLAYPEKQIVTTAVNGVPFGGASDTLSALEKVTVSGEVRDESGSLLSDFNGVVSPTIFDKSKVINTLVNDPGLSLPYTFDLQKNIIYRGNASVTDGKFSFTFIVPKDISYTIGNGKISYYADNGEIDANGFDSGIVIGGTADSVTADNEGPDVQIYMNDESFAFGGITDENPVMLVKLSDESGINTVGNGIGHDITSKFDEDEQSVVTLNDFYESELDNFQKGEVRYLLNDLEPGRHQIVVKAWDVYNNSGEGYTEFVVAESAELALDHVLNYPNPFTTNTSFMFEHNRPGDMLNVKIEVFTVGGKRIKTIVQDVITDGFRVDAINWDGLDDFGDTIGRGVYVYKVSVRSLSDFKSATEFQKLVLLR